ncbi:serine/threonine-protein kinase RsbW [Geoalkalibacter ferrihydriticus]|jgi:serine/threonine-protein kinase RsbW|uniref:Anti-sigma factor n=2 Tax=Geoalkalibacter ferrihydriticus TaxID=392333 RepID=A0A0C2HI58_9BACT|nr:ATP-binding protein [Geoalkalibacter ferrihydriticus]KIH76626.1 anti-sigma factor [Geoalkalibacter ferrihydriticus DSM 17813]SDM04166.1 serine/threonine-protein kinase RsbW [Geoalkalibacter ferrihydriticus]
MKKEKIEVDIKVPNQTRYLSLIGKIGEDVARTLKRYKGDREELAYHINLVLTESMTNAIRHAHEGDPSKEVHITITIQDKELCIKVYDQGQGFDISTLPVPEVRCLEEHGRGVFIIHTLMDSVSYRKFNGGHVLEMIKALQ